MERILKTESFQTSLTLVRARLFDGWAVAATPKEREDLHAELRALERLMEAFRDIDSEGAVAREAIRRINESNTGLLE